MTSRGRVLRYDRLSWRPQDQIKYQNLSSEVYEYGKNGLLEFAYWGRSFAGITEVDKYHFNHDVSIPREIAHLYRSN